MEVDGQSPMDLTRMASFRISNGFRYQLWPIRPHMSDSLSLGPGWLAIHTLPWASLSTSLASWVDKHNSRSPSRVHRYDVFMQYRNENIELYVRCSCLIRVTGQYAEQTNQ